MALQKRLIQHRQKSKRLLTPYRQRAGDRDDERLPSPTKKTDSAQTTVKRLLTSHSGINELATTNPFVARKRRLIQYKQQPKRLLNFHSGINEQVMMTGSAW